MAGRGPIVMPMDGGDDPNGPYAEAPLAEDPTAESIDSYQSTPIRPPRPLSAIPPGRRLPPANVAAGSRPPTVVNARQGIDPEIMKALAQADRNPGMQNAPILEQLPSKGANVDMEQFRKSGGRNISGTINPRVAPTAKYGELDVKHYVDSIENGQALLLGEKGSEERVPQQVLPPDVREGDWIQNGRVISPPADNGVRKKLATGDPGGTINLDGAQPRRMAALSEDPRPTGEPQLLESYTADGIVYDPNQHARNREAAKRRKQEDLAPFTQLGDLGGYSAAIKAAAETGNESLVTKLVSAAVDKQEREAQKRQYSLTAEDIQARDEANRASRERSAALSAGTRGAAGRAAAKPGEGTNAVAAYIQAHPDDQKGAIELASQFPDQIPDPVRAVTTLSRQPVKAANATMNDENGNPIGQAGSTADKTRIAKVMQNSDSFLRAAKILREKVSKNESMWLPGSGFSGEGKVRNQQMVDLIAFGRQAEGLPSTDFATKLEQGGLGGSGVGLMENLKHPTISVEVLDNIIARQEAAVKALKSHSLRPTSVGSQLQGAAQKKTGGGQAPLDDLLKQAGY